MKKRKVFAALLAAATLCSGCFLTGCGSDKPTSSGSASAPAPQGSGTSKPAAEKVTVEYYTWADEDVYMPAIVEAFNAQSETTQVNLTIVPSSASDPDAYENKITALLAGGGDLDLFGTSVVKNFAKRRDVGNLADMTGAIQAAGIDLSRYGEDFQTTLADGKCYGLPYRFSAYALFYNKKIFDAEGVPYPEKMTWDEYAVLAKSLTKTRDDGTKQWGGFLPNWMGEPIMTVQMGSNVLDPDSGAFKEWLSLLNRIYNEDASHMSFEEMNSTSTDWLKIFLNGDVAMLPNGEWTVGNAKQELANNAELAGKCDMGVTYMPQPDGVQEPVTIGGHNTFIFISSQSKKFENAFEFIRFLTGAEGAKLLAEGGMLSSYTDDTIEQEYRELSGLDNTDAFFNTEIRYEMPPTGNGAEVDAIWREEKELCLIGEKSVDEAIASFDQRRTPLLSQE